MGGGECPSSLRDGCLKWFIGELGCDLRAPMEQSAGIGDGPLFRAYACQALEHPALPAPVAKLAAHQER